MNTQQPIDLEKLDKALLEKPYHRNASENTLVDTAAANYLEQQKRFVEMEIAFPQYEELQQHVWCLENQIAHDLIPRSVADNYKDVLSKIYTNCHPWPSVKKMIEDAFEFEAHNAK